MKISEVAALQWFLRLYESLCEALLVPLAGIEPALLAELDFESSASTSSATGALGRRVEPPSRSRRNIAGGIVGSTRVEVIAHRLDRAVAAGYDAVIAGERP